jgi:hypothetical protein
MGLFHKLFGGSKKQTDPENSRLLELIEIYQKQNGKGEAYKNVVLELMKGNSFLLLPSHNDNELSTSWTNAKTGTTLKLTCIYNLDGLKVLGAFTDEQSLLNWAKQPTQYTAVASKAILNLCEEQLIQRIMINSNQPNMFVLERNRQNIKTETIKEETTVQIGTPLRPLESKIIQKLNEHFKRVATIEEVYQYGQTKNNEFSIVLGFKLSPISENAKTASINAVQNALQGEKVDQLLDLFFIEEDGWYQTIRNTKDSLIYTKSKSEDTTS